MKDLSIDLETMGTKAGCPVMSIGAVYFDPLTGETGAEFYMTISLESCMEVGLIPEADTIMWWMQQSDEARGEFVRKIKHPIRKVLNEFFEFAKGSRPWGNGATFDVSILEHALGAIGRPAPWKFWEIRDVRTVVDLVMRVESVDLRSSIFEGEKHNALDDAKHQAKMVSRGFRLLKDAQ